MDALAERARWMIEPELALCRLYSRSGQYGVLPCIVEDAGGRLVWDPAPTPQTHSVQARRILDEARCRALLPSTLQRAREGLASRTLTTYLPAYPKDSPPKTDWMWCSMPARAPDMHLVNTLISAMDTNDLSNGEIDRLLLTLMEAGVCEICQGPAMIATYYEIQPPAVAAAYPVLKIIKRGWLVRGTVVRKLLLGNPTAPSVANAEPAAINAA